MLKNILLKTFQKKMTMFLYMTIVVVWFYILRVSDISNISNYTFIFDCVCMK